MNLSKSLKTLNQWSVRPLSNEIRCFNSGHLVQQRLLHIEQNARIASLSSISNHWRCSSSFILDEDKSECCRCRWISFANRQCFIRRYRRICKCQIAARSRTAPSLSRKAKLTLLRNVCRMTKIFFFFIGEIPRSLSIDHRIVLKENVRSNDWGDARSEIDLVFASIDEFHIERWFCSHICTIIIDKFDFKLNVNHRGNFAKDILIEQDNWTNRPACPNDNFFSVGLFQFSLQLNMRTINEERSWVSFIGKGSIAQSDKIYFCLCAQTPW